jgi:hypothetical protein
MKSPDNTMTISPKQKVYTDSVPQEIGKMAKGGKFPCFHYCPRRGRMAAGWAKIEGRGPKSTTLEVITDKGSFNLCGENPVLTADGKEVLANELRPGMRLMALSVHLGSEKYLEMGLLTGKDGKRKVHRLLLEDLLGEKLSGKVVHHKDENCHNNSLSNLAVLNPSEHSKLHNKLLLEAHLHHFQTDNPAWNPKNRKAFKKRASELQKKSNKQRMLNRLWKTINEAKGKKLVTLWDYLDARGVSKPSERARTLESVGTHFGSFRKMLAELGEKNHEILAIKRTSQVRPWIVTGPENMLLWSNENPERTGRGIFLAEI